MPTKLPASPTGLTAAQAAVHLGLAPGSFYTGSDGAVRVYSGVDYSKEYGLGPPAPELVRIVRMAARVILGPVKGWAASGFMSRKRERELDRRLARLDRRLARLGSPVWATPSRPCLTLGRLHVTVDMGPDHASLARWAAALVALAELLPDPAPELLALSVVLRTEGRATVSWGAEKESK